MKYTHILAIDPSGNFEEGFGTTGWVLMDSTEKLIASGVIRANDYDCKEKYWNEHLKLIKYNIERHNVTHNDRLLVVIEDYLLYRDKAMSQANSKMETPKLIGILQYYCWTRKQPYSMQPATSVKSRWSDDVMLREGIIKRRGRDIIHTQSGFDLSVVHIRDAFRHAIHYVVTRNEERNNSYAPRQIKTRSNYQSGYGEGTTYSSSNRSYKGYSEDKRVRNTKVWRQR